MLDGAALMPSGRQADQAEPMGPFVWSHDKNALFIDERGASLPQCQLRLARFRGTDKREFLDQRQLNGHAFLLLEEAILFCQRHYSQQGAAISLAVFDDRLEL